MIYRRLYTCIFYLLLPAILLRLLFRSLKAPAYRYRWAERFGFFSGATINNQRAIWVHAVSVGEVLAALPLIKALQQQYPDTVLVITTTTPTGSERVQVLFAKDIAAQKLLHVYSPYDIPFALENFLQRIKPQVVIVMETELWPNMIHTCFIKKIPLIIVNARLSEKSANGYAWLSGLTKTMLIEVNQVAAQNQQDGQRFINLGLCQDKLIITGSIKFDLDLPARVHQQAEELKKTWSNNGERLVLLAASTHSGEDEIIIAAFKQCKRKFPNLLLVLVPRHPERFSSVYQLCLKNGFETARRSETKKITGSLIEKNTDIIIGDTMGELLAFYGACDIAFVGGSLVPVGGHNLIEPAAWAKPIVCGKHLFNFAEVASLLDNEQALIICNTEEELQHKFEMLLLSESKRLSMGSAAQRIANENRGALEKLMATIKKVMV